MPPGSPGGDDGSSRRVIIVLAALVAAVAGLAIGALVVAGGNDKTKTVTSTGTTTVTTATATTDTTTTTTEPTISQQSAKGAAASAASDAADQAGVSIPPSGFDVRCTAEGGGSQASTWNCQASSTNGQCSGPVTVVATANGAADVQDNQVACGE